MPEATPITIEQIGRAARKLSQLRPAYAAMLAFYEDVFTAQEKSKSAIDLEPIRLSPDSVDTSRQKGRPLVRVSDLQFDSAAGAGLLSEVCRLIATHGTNIKASADAVAGALERRVINPQHLFKGLLEGDDSLFQSTATRIGADPQALAFIAYHSIQPAIELSAVQLATYLAPDAVRHQGQCPICGSAPGFAILGHEGRRVLCCGFCRHQWRAPRIFCAFCENTQTDQLHYFFAEEEKDLRVDVCDRCRQFLKSIDDREVARPVFPPLEQVASLHLDMIAVEKGYKGGADLNLES